MKYDVVIVGGGARWIGVGQQIGGKREYLRSVAGSWAGLP